MSAGPGWGKTLTTAAWAATLEGDRATAWLSLDESDNDPRVFWAYFIAALRSSGAVPAASPLVNLEPLAGDRTHFIRRLAVGLAELPSSVVLVLDDFHLIHDPKVLAGLTELLRLRIEQLRLVLLTRAESPLPLHRLVVDDELTEIRGHDLAFHVAEAREFLTGHGVPVSHDEALLLVRRTEGWPAGLRLAALFLDRQGSQRRVSDFAGDDRIVARYLAEEVLGGLSEEMRQFLLRTSITDRVCSELGTVLTGQGHAQHHLETLEASNAFVVGLGPGRQWFRYHTLMREMLRHRLSAEQPQELAALHRRAARWFADNDQLITALRHAGKSADWQLFARLFVTHGPSLPLSVDRDLIAQILLDVPSSELTDGPELALVAAARLFHTGQYDQIEPYLEYAASHLDQAAPESRTGAMVTQRTLATVVARIRGDMPRLWRNSTEVLDLVPAEDHASAEASAIRAIAFAGVGVSCLWSGQLVEAKEALRQGLAAAEAARFELPRVNLLAHLALADAEEGRHRSASDLAAQALKIAELRGWGDPSQAAPAYLALAMVEMHRDNLKEAHGMLAQGRVAAAAERVTRSAFDLLQVRFDAESGRVDTAGALFSRIRADLEDWQPPDLLLGWRVIAEAEVELAAGNLAGALAILSDGATPPSTSLQVCLARALLASGDAQGADEVLAPLRAADLGEPVPLSHSIDTWTLTALAADARREDNRAVDAIRQAVVASSATGIRRPLIRHHGIAIRRLLGRLEAVDPDMFEAVAGLRAHLSSADAASAPGNNMELTDREMMILRLLASGMTNADIAEELVLSVNTIKVHLKHINRKLEVDTRRQAVHRARKLGLLDSPGTPRPD